MDDEQTRDEFVAAYMTLTGGTEEEARAIVDILLDPDPTRFRQGLDDWVGSGPPCLDTPKPRS